MLLTFLLSSRVPPSYAPNSLSPPPSERSFPPPLIKTPTPLAPPWMIGPPNPNSSNDHDLSLSPNPPPSSTAPPLSLARGVRGGRSRRAVKKIAQGLNRLHSPHLDSALDSASDSDEFRVPLGEAEGGRRRRVPWERAERVVFPREKKERAPTAAELTLPAEELARLREEASGMRTWVKVRKAGVTAEKVAEIRRTWEGSELAMVKFGQPLCRNMERAAEIIELKTGGMVVWSKKDSLVVYRGSNHPSLSIQQPTLAYDETFTIGNSGGDNNSSQHEMTAANEERAVLLHARLVVGKYQSSEATLYEREADRLLDGLGPRFVDWWWPKPLPVDADALPEVIPNFKPPLRLFPSNMRPQLRDDELTYLRKLARPLPTHFVLGRNSKLQGLAAAILKLWEKSLIVKIAIKWGIPNTNNAQMSLELKRLTGGVLILRNKFFIILYRGKDFLPPSVASSLAQRESELKTKIDEEEVARSKAVESFHATDEALPVLGTTGTYSEFQDIHLKSGHSDDDNWEIKMQIEAEEERLEKELRKQERKLLILQLKTQRSEKDLAKLNSAWRSADQSPDQEMLTEEERQIFRKIALKMGRSLFLGRRGVFDGVIGSMHQHWKHREVVKVISMQKAYSQIINTAIILEIESGGTLVSVEKLSNGHAIIIYRGKNYRRPVKLLPENLLTKNEALKLSIEMQRRGCLKYFAYQRQRAICGLKERLRELEERRKQLLL